MPRVPTRKAAVVANSAGHRSLAHPPGAWVRIRRRLFNAVAGLSLGVCLALAVLWAWTREHHAVVTREFHGRLVYLVTWSEGIRLDLVSDWPTHEPLQWSSGSFRESDSHVDFRFRGSGAARIDPPGLARESGDAMISLNHGPWLMRPYHGLVLRWWPPFLVAAFVPALWIVMKLLDRYRRRREARLRSQVRCVRCGYDLRANPNRCPECGTVPNQS